MNEKSKNFWRKSWTGRSAVLIWCALVVFALFLATFIVSLLNIERPVGSFFMAIGLIGVVGVVGCLFAIYVIWPVLRWLIWKHWRRSFFLIACFFTLIALFYAEENWRGRHDWEKFKREQEAKGERFDFASIIPPAVPDNENFAFSPVWIAEEKNNFLNQPKRAEAWYGAQIYSDEVSKILAQLPISTSGLVGTNWWANSRIHLPQTPDLQGHWAETRFTELKPWQSYYRDLQKTNPAAAISITLQPQSPAADVLLALSKFDPVIDRLQQDCAKPYSRFPIQYDDADKFAILLPHLAAEKRIAQVLQLRAIAELQNNETEKAFADVNLMMRLIDASRTEPFLISHLVRIAIFDLTSQPIWEGLAKHQWSGAQLQTLEDNLKTVNFLNDYKSSLQAERLGDINQIELYQNDRNIHKFDAFISMVRGINQNDQANARPGLFILYFLAPSGWFELNKIWINQFLMEHSTAVVDTNSQIFSPSAVKAAKEAALRELKNTCHDNFFANNFIPLLDAWNSTVCFPYGQNNVNLARTAIALERYRLANGNYPKALNEVAPQFMKEIPHDIINGQPLKYRREADGQFVLYSVGWNETDDGGVVVLKKGSSPEVDIEQGDWVWRYPQK